MGKPSLKAMMLFAVRKAEKNLTPAYEQTMRKYIANTPDWTQEAVNSINMRYKNGGHVITYSDDRVLDLENGTPDREKSPAIRSFMIDRSGK